MPEPVSLEELKAHLDHARSDQDDMLTGMIVAAREWVESYTGHFLVLRDVTEGFDCFSQVHDLKAWPVAANAPVTIAYADADGVEQTVEAPRLNVLRRPARIYPAYGASWPAAYHGSIVVTVPAGYPTAEAVPSILKMAMLVHCREYYDFRTIRPEVVTALENICRAFPLSGLG